MLRVAGLDELFEAVETLGRIKPLRGERLAIVANGRAMAAMAVDTLIGKDGRLAAIGDATVESLRKTATVAHLIGNPIILNENHRDVAGRSRGSRPWAMYRRMVFASNGQSLSIGRVSS